MGAFIRNWKPREMGKLVGFYVNFNEVHKFDEVWLGKGDMIYWYDLIMGKT